MTPLPVIERPTDIAAAMLDLGRRARQASRALALAPAARKDAALTAMAQAIRRASADVLVANAEDLLQARAAGATPASKSLAALL